MDVLYHGMLLLSDSPLALSCTDTGSILKDVQLLFSDTYPHLSCTDTGSILKDVHQGLLNYQITDTAISWARIFGMMERAKEGLHIEDYSVGQTTLEQVRQRSRKCARCRTQNSTCLVICVTTDKLASQSPLFVFITIFV